MNANIFSNPEKMQPTIGIIVNDRKSAGRPIKEVIAGSCVLLDKLDDAFEGMLDYTDAFLDGWFAIRKIKGRHKPKDKGPKDPGENN